MRKFIQIIIATGILFIATAGFATVPFTTGNSNQFSPSQCKKPIKCGADVNYRSLTEANACGCCTCDGGAAGCAGGAKGRVICMNGQIASNCACQYTLSNTN